MKESGVYVQDKKDEKKSGGNPSRGKYNINNSVSNNEKEYNKDKYKNSKSKHQKKVPYNKNVHCFDCGKENERRGHADCPHPGEWNFTPLKNNNTSVEALNKRKKELEVMKKNTSSLINKATEPKSVLKKDSDTKLNMHKFQNQLVERETPKKDQSESINDINKLVSEEYQMNYINNNKQIEDNYFKNTKSDIRTRLQQMEMSRMQRSNDSQSESTSKRTRDSNDIDILVQ
jgi:hypothetical protein